MAYVEVGWAGACCEVTGAVGATCAVMDEDESAAFAEIGRSGPEWEYRLVPSAKKCSPKSPKIDVGCIARQLI